MFTPPPSPLPGPFKYSDATPHLVSSSLPILPTSSIAPAFKLSSAPALAKYPVCARREHARVLATHERKRQTGWRIYMTAIMVPLSLAVVTLSTRYFTLPSLVDLVAGIVPESHPSHACQLNCVSVHPPQRRQTGPNVIPAGVPSSSFTPPEITFPSIHAVSSSASPTPTQTPSSTVPTIPSLSPVLPTPFPQPFDTTLTNNFTTTTCESFFTNMTQSAPFRQCRPFSFLSQTSSAFLQVSGSSNLVGYQNSYCCAFPPVGRHNPILRLSTSMSGALVTLPWMWISARPTWAGLHQTYLEHVPRRKANKTKWCYRRLQVYSLPFLM